MNQETINVTLLAIDENTDILRFAIDGQDVDINLNEVDCQTSMKNMFSILLQKAIHADVFLQFEVDLNYTRGMYIEVCEEYIKDLNRELAEVIDTIRRELES